LETRERIIRSALELSLQHGYENTSMNQIARKVKITKPAIYYHFKSKDELFREVFSYFFEKMGKWSSSQFSACKNLKELLWTFMRSLQPFKEVTGVVLGARKRKTRYSFLELMLSASKRDRRIQKKIEEGFILSRKRLADELRKAQEIGEIRDDIDCEACAFQIHALIEGAGLISYMDQSVDLDAIGEKLFESMWVMIGK
jgi:AcrR family transcriptional regulator